MIEHEITEADLKWNGCQAIIKDGRRIAAKIEVGSRPFIKDGITYPKCFLASIGGCGWRCGSLEEALSALNSFFENKRIFFCSI